VLQVSPVEALTEIPEIGPGRLAADLGVLLDQASPYDDLHDVICRVGGRRYALHSFILAAGSETLCKQIKYAEAAATATSPLPLDIEAVEPVIFEEVVRYLYTRTCSLLVAGPCALNLDPQTKGTAATQQQQESDDNQNFISLGADEDPFALSAFSVYNDRHRGKRRNNKRPAAGVGEGGGMAGVECPAAVAATPAKSGNPLALLQEAAKNLGIHSLVKIVDCFR
jgi:hypothetical protein